MIVLEQEYGTNSVQLQREIIEVSPSVVRIFTDAMASKVIDASQLSGNVLALGSSDLNNFIYISDAVLGQEYVIQLDDLLAINKPVIIKLAQENKFTLMPDTLPIIPPQGYSLEGDGSLIFEGEENLVFGILITQEGVQVI